MRNASRVGANAPTTGEQDGWAYVATGSETYAQWERHHQRQVDHLRELEKYAPTTRALAEVRRSRDRALKTLRAQGRLDPEWYRA